MKFELVSHFCENNIWTTIHWANDMHERLQLANLQCNHPLLEILAAQGMYSLFPSALEALIAHRFPDKPPPPPVRNVHVDLSCLDYDMTSSFLYPQPHYVVTYAILGKITNWHI